MSTKASLTAPAFTPAPWYAGGHPSHKVNNFWIFDGSTRPKLIADCHPEDGIWIPFKERDANSFLIAAAPELYEALRGMVDHFESIGGDAYLPAYEKAEQALNKALNL